MDAGSYKKMRSENWFDEYVFIRFVKKMFL